MATSFFNRLCLLLAFVCSYSIFSGCFKNLTQKTVVYNNTFEKGQMGGIEATNSNGIMPNPIIDFNGNKILGRLNNAGILLTLQLPEHNLVQIEFDLYIHDQWQGNFIRPGSTIPDIWQLTIDDNPLFITTFSNGPYPQSYPLNIDQGQHNNPARGDAADTTLPGACSWKDLPNGTTCYHYTLIQPHNKQLLVLKCSDALQPYNEICLKSWSIDNLKITAIEN